MATAVLTRDPGDAAAYASVLAELGLELIAMPVTRTVSAGDPDALVRALGDGRYAAIVVASPRAAAALASAAERAGVHEPPEIWAVGPATRDVLEAARLPVHLPDEVRDGGELAARLAMSRDLRGERVLIPRAEQGRPEILDTLREAGAIVVDVICYRTVAVDPSDAAVERGAAALASGAAAICAVFAPSQVNALAAILETRGRALASLAVQFCAIGETTAAALREAGVADVAVATAPTPEGMAHAVRSVYPPKA